VIIELGVQLTDVEVGFVTRKFVIAKAIGPSAKSWYVAAGTEGKVRMQLNPPIEFVIHPVEVKSYGDLLSAFKTKLISLDGSNMDPYTVITLPGTPAAGEVEIDGTPTRFPPAESL
jgi:hypothetical protein